MSDKQPPWASSGIDWPEPVDPVIVEYGGEDEATYLVRDLFNNEVIEVPKRYAAPDPFPTKGMAPQRGVRLLRWSTYALIADAAAGVGGVILGVLVIVIALIRLRQLSIRVRAWRKRWYDEIEVQPLPPAATLERLRLLGALGQGLIAVMIGAGLCALFLPDLQLLPFLH